MVRSQRRRAVLRWIKVTCELLFPLECRTGGCHLLSAHPVPGCTFCPFPLSLSWGGAGAAGNCREQGEAMEGEFDPCLLPVPTLGCVEGSQHHLLFAHPLFPSVLPSAHSPGLPLRNFDYKLFCAKNQIPLQEFWKLLLAGWDGGLECIILGAESVLYSQWKHLISLFYCENNLFEVLGCKSWALEEAIKKYFFFSACFEQCAVKRSRRGSSGHRRWNVILSFFSVLNKMGNFWRKIRCDKVIRLYHHTGFSGSNTKAQQISELLNTWLCNLAEVFLIQIGVV